MEQLSSHAIRQLLQSAREGAAGAVKPQPWVRPESYGPDGHGRQSFAGDISGSIPGVRMRGTPQSPGGIERRLVRRAEAMWLGLKPAGALPPVSEAHRFVSAPLAAQALLLSLPPGGAPEIRFAGEALAELARVRPGPAVADSRNSASLAERLAALAVQAVVSGEPALMDSDCDAPAGKPHLLLRAIALPFQPEEGAPGVPAAVVVASWRKLLSARETAALHRELAAAIGWMHGNMENRS